MLTNNNFINQGIGLTAKTFKKYIAQICDFKEEKINILLAQRDETIREFTYFIFQYNNLFYELKDATLMPLSPLEAEEILNQ